MLKNWVGLYNKAVNNLNNKELSSFITIGNYSCIIKTVSNNIYTGINIKTNSNLDNNAENIAILNMINNGENEVSQLILINELEEIIKPSVESLEYLLSLSINNMNTDIMIDDEKIVKLYELLPDWWGTYHPR